MKFKRIVSLVLTCALVLSLSVTGALADSYTVVKGDSLWRIAARLLGSGTKWSTIYEANRDTIRDPNMIYVGQVLNVPGTETEQPPVENPPVEEPPVTTSVVVDPSQPIAVEGGSITGTLTEDGQIAMWKGIPYAAPPVDALRWKAPQPVVAWSGVRACTEYGHSAMQRFQEAAAPYTAEFLINDFDGVSEDCLYLNVWSKAGSTDALRPVIFYIHGGGFTSGGANCDIYDGELMSREDVVFVSINYRLGIFGFMAHPELSAQSESGTSGNYALLDWIKALKWVQDYIAQFGGDPGNVTIVGQSAGAGAVNALIGSPMAAGLFDKAFVMSGSRNAGDTPLADAEAAGVALCEKQGKTLAELQAMPAAELQKLRWDYSVVNDGYAITDETWNHLTNGTANDVSIITGKVSGDAGMFTRNCGLDVSKYSDTMPIADYEAAVRNAFGELADRALALYPVEGDNALPVANELNMDLMRYDLAQYGRGKADGSSTRPVYLYTYDWPYAGLTSQGAFHSSDIAYWLGGLFTKEKTTWSATDSKLANAMSGYLLNFAKTGNVNGDGLPQWKAYDGNTTYLSITGNSIETVSMSNEKAQLIVDYNEWLATRPPEEKDPTVLPPNSAEIAWSDSLADCTGVLTIDPVTNEWAIVFTNSFNPAGYNIKGTYDPETYALTVTDDAGLGGFLELDPLQAVAGPAIRDILFSKEIAWSDSLADCTGKLTIDPATNEWAIVFTNSFNPAGYNIKGTYDPETYALTVTDDAGLGGFLELDPLQAVAGPAIRDILFSREISWSDSLADCTGKLTIDPATNEWAITFTNSFNPAGYNIKGTYDPETYALTVTDDAGLGGFLELDPLQAVAGPAIKSILGK